MKRAVRAVRPSAKRNKRLEATRHARALSPFSSSSLNTGTNAELSARSATRARTRFGTWNATVKALIPPSAPNVRAAMTSRRRPAMREMPVRTEKMAVDRASRRPWPDRPSGSSTTGASATFGEYRPVVGHGLLVGARRVLASLHPGRCRGLLRHAQHQATGTARHYGGTAAAREPPLALGSPRRCSAASSARSRRVTRS